MANTGIEKRKANTKEGHTYTKERSPDCFCFLLLNLLFFFTPFFHDFKGIKTKEKDKDKENRVRIRPFLDGYGLGTRIRTTSVRILIPGPAADPLLRIRSPVLALKHGLAGLVLHFLNGLF